MINKHDKRIRNVFPGILCILFILFSGTDHAFTRELEAGGISGERIIICMDLLELELPDDDSSGDQMELPDIEKIEDPALAGTSSPSQGQVRDIPKIKSVPIRSPAPPEPAFSPELSPFLFPGPEKTTRKPREQLAPTMDNPSEPVGELKPMELKALPVPSFDTEAGTPAAIEPLKTRDPSVPPEIPLLDLKDWKQEPTSSLPPQPATGLKQPAIVPQKGLDFMVAPVNSQPQRSLPLNEKIDSTLVRIYERFFK